MGRTIVQLVHEAADLSLVAAVDAAQSPLLGRDAGELAGVAPAGVKVTEQLSALDGADVVIDFSLPVALPRLFDRLQEKPLPLVLATTGVDAQRMPLVAAPNYRLGVAVLYHLAEQATALLPGFDLEIIEMHHRNKVDAPSGTALGLLDAAARGRNQDGRAHAVFGRQGHPGARSDAEIGVMTLRGGDVIGDHTLILAGAGERLELSHRASNRSLFAHGALRAARYLIGKSPGRYTMPQVLGLAR
jgi:4-hydroxy-tetrahydrodipicolinate reductase